MALLLVSLLFLRGGEAFDPTVQLVTAGGAIPTSGADLIVVAQGAAGDANAMQFRWFGPRGTRTDFAPQDLRDHAQGRLGADSEVELLARRLEALGATLEPYWARPDLTLDDLSTISGPLLEVVGPYIASNILSGFGTDWGFRDAGLLAAKLLAGVTSSVLFEDFPRLLLAQLTRLGQVLVFSLVPGVVGLIYRRAFVRWFLASFVLLTALNTGLDLIGQGSITPTVRNALENGWVVPLFLVLEMQVFFLLLASRLRMHRVAALDGRQKLETRLWSAGVAVLALTSLVLLARVVLPGEPSVPAYRLLLWLEGTVAAAAIAYALFRQSLAPPPAGRKNIVLCVDGTWNEPGQRDLGRLAETNVLKLYRLLEGVRPKTEFNAGGVKEYVDDDGAVRQVSFYYRGVGNSMENSEIGQTLGGMFGWGADGIVERAYLDLARVYRPGDRIFIFGFSRGAAIARLIAGVIDRREVPTSQWTLRLFGRHWVVWQSRDCQADVEVEVLGCWDTVGAFGISKNVLGIPFQSINLLKDLDVPRAVRRAYHMVALDETRDAFVPTLMQPDLLDPHRIVEVWFSGNHANVGGGYATDRLSNVALAFLLEHVSSGYAPDESRRPGDESWGLYLTASASTRPLQDDEIPTGRIDADPLGQLRRAGGAIYTDIVRELPLHAVVHDTVFERMAASPEVYAPQSVFDLNAQLLEKRRTLETEIDQLAATGSLTTEEAERALEASKARLTMTRWSDHLDAKTSHGLAMGQLIDPATELANTIQAGDGGYSPPPGEGADRVATRAGTSQE